MENDVRFCEENNASVNIVVYRKYPSFKKDFNYCLHHSDTVEEFESLWENLVEQYELQDYDWFGYMYRIRNKWMPIFFKNTFFAGMSTTQRSESMNKLFDGYVHIRTTLSEFVIQFEKAIGNRRQKENKQDFKTMNEQPNLKTSFAMEKQIAGIYTRKIFKQFQKEIWESAGYICKLIDEDMGVEAFMRLCVTKFPQHYVLKRWTSMSKDGVAYNVHGDQIQPDLQKSITIRFEDLCYFANKCTQSGALYERTCQFAKENLKNVLAGIDSMDNEKMTKYANKEATSSMTRLLE